MDKAMYKQLVADLMKNESELREKIDEIKSLIENNSNDDDLGKKIRTINLGVEENTNQIGLFNE